jgi:uncharacterized protein
MLDWKDAPHPAAQRSGFPSPLRGGVRGGGKTPGSPLPFHPTRIGAQSARRSTLPVEGRVSARGAAKCISVCGKAFIADASGALYWPAKGALLVADLHLEKGSAWAERGTLLPPYDTRHTLLRLADVIERYEPRVVVALGDSFHDAGGPTRIDRDDLEVLRQLQAGREWIWIAGNHDRGIGPGVGGQVCDALDIDGLTLRHEPGAVGNEIAGHLHPAARLTFQGCSVRRPCFVGNGRRLVLPAFGAFTGGLNVLDEAFAPLFGDSLAVWMLGQVGLYPISPRHLRAD